MATVLLIHGAWLTPSSFDRFRQRYEQAGATVLAPAWPHMEGAPRVIGRWFTQSMAELRFGDLEAHFAQIARQLPEPPVLIGHGLGGSLVSRLLARGIGRAGAAIAPIPLGSLDTARALLRQVGPLQALFGRRRVLRMSEQRFSTVLAQTLSRAEKAYAFEKFIVPAPGGVLRDVLFNAGAPPAPSRSRTPLLLIAGGNDRAVPPALVRSMHRGSSRSGTLSALRTFEGRSHWLCNEAGWEEVADAALSWTLAHASRSTAAA